MSAPNHTASFASTLDAIHKSGKKILVVGLGVTGVETARFLSARGIKVICTERQQEDQFREKSKFLAGLSALRSLGVEIQFGIDGEKIQPFLNEVALAVLSPGVPLESAIVGALTRVGIPHVSELELGVMLHGGPCVVVTGSNGKTTTVALIHHIFKHAAVPSFLCGNVGTPVLASEELQLSPEMRKSILVVEASSYQLEACTALKPKVSVILNISENHLERHGTIDRYAAAKAAAVRLQTHGDTTILNGDDPVLRRLAASCKGEVLFFGQGEPGGFCKADAQGVGIQRSEKEGTDELIGVIRQDGSLKKERYALHSAALIGEHNRYNMAAAVAVCRSFGVSQKIVNEALISFKPLEHRLEIVGQDDCVLAINDSKSTTVAASKAAVKTVREHFAGRPVVIMIGGLSKAGSWDPLLRFIVAAGDTSTPVVCFGKDGPLLANHCNASGIPNLTAPSMKVGVEVAYKEARRLGGVVLLTPGCASFDEFSDFEHRGRIFKEEITKFLSTSATQKGVAA